MLRAAVAAVCALPRPLGLGSGPILDEHISSVAEAMTQLGRDLAMRMATREGQTATQGPVDTRREAVLAGMPERQAQTLRAVGRFANEHALVERAWRSGELSQEQMQILGKAANSLPDEVANELVDKVVPVLHGLSARETRRLVEIVVDQLAPKDPEAADRTHYAARHLSWTGIDGGLTFQGFLPTLEASAFKAAIEAMAESLRVAGDGVRVGQRRADALAAVIAKAAAHGLPTGGGLPAAVTLTVSLSEAERIATGNPAAYGRGGGRRPRGSAMVDAPPHGPTHTIGDAAVRFALCAAAITPMIIGPRSVATRSQGPGAVEDLIIDVRDTPDGTGTSTGYPGAPLGPAPGAPPGAVRSASQLGAGGSTSPPAADGTASPSDAEKSPSPRHALTDHVTDSVLGMLSTIPVEPLAVGRAVRLATPAQRRALHQRDQGCVVPGCQIPAAYTQPHHVNPWHWDGPTDQDNLVTCCWVHHRQIELGYFTIVPRHPGDQRPPGALEHPHWWVIPHTEHGRHVDAGGLGALRDPGAGARCTA